MPTPLLAGLLVASLLAANGLAATGSDVQARMDADIASGRPIVVHVTVALCDNANQGIVRVSPELGNGQDPRTNLYWGALYGVRTHFRRTDGWAVAEVAVPDNPRVLDRVAFTASLTRGERSVPVHVIADAWDGAHIRDAIAAFLQMAAGGLTEEILVTGETPVVDTTKAQRELGWSPAWSGLEALRSMTGPEEESV